MTQGYVVIQPRDIPIVGPTGQMNDHYVDELREDLDLDDRRGRRRRAISIATASASAATATARSAR